MNLKTIANAVTSRTGRQVLQLQKHSPKLMFVAGVVSVGAAVVLACRATLKVEDVLEDHDKMKSEIGRVQGLSMQDVVVYSEQDQKRDMVLLHAKTFGRMIKLYAPSVVVGVAGIALLTGAHVVLSRRNVALTAAYAAIDKGFREYRQRVVEELGSEKDQDFRHGLVYEETTDADGNKVRTGRMEAEKDTSAYSFFFDEQSTLWSRAPGQNQMTLRCQQNYANDLLQARGHVFLNEVLSMLGLAHTKAGAVTGWVLRAGGDDYIDFGVFRGDEYRALMFVNGDEKSIKLDFNVDGIIYDKI